MRNLLFTALMMLMTMTMVGQELFTTNTTNAAGMGSAPMLVEWSITESGEVTMTYKDKSTVKMMQQVGQPVSTTLPYKVKPEVDGNGATYYVYQDDSNQLTLMPYNPSVVWKIRDTFMGTATQTMYINR